MMNDRLQNCSQTTAPLRATRHNQEHPRKMTGVFGVLHYPFLKTLRKVSHVWRPLFWIVDRIAGHLRWRLRALSIRGTVGTACRFWPVAAGCHHH